MSYLVHILSNINFQELKRYVFIVFLKQFVVIAHLSSFGMSSVWKEHGSVFGHTCNMNLIVS